MPAMVPWRATEDGHVTPEVLAWYERFAEGRPGALVVEATGIRDIPSGPLLRIGHDRFIPGLTQLVETVRQASGGQTRLFIQIIDFLRIRRRPEPARYFGEFLAITDAAPRPGTRERPRDPRGAGRGCRTPSWREMLSTRELDALHFGERELVTDIDLPHIRELPQVLPGIFGDAARRAEPAGFDGVELHYAHAYTMASFLSATERPGRTATAAAAENRVRLPLEVYRAVRGAVTQRFVVGCRFLAEECIPGGSPAEDAALFGAEVRAGRDGLPFALPGWKVRGREAAEDRLGPLSLYRPERLRVHADGAFGRTWALRPERRRGQARCVARCATQGTARPWCCAAGFRPSSRPKRLLQDGAADIVASARQSLADPDWFRKLRLGRGDEVRRCVFTNYCEGLDQVHKPVTCKLWDHLGLERRRRLA